MNNDLFAIILSLIPVVAAVATYIFNKYVKASVNTEKLKQYTEWTMMAVRAAEMIWTESGMGADKKAYVVKFLNEKINKDKIILTEEQISILIESCVNQLNFDKKIANQ